jgi:hypothetical protein
MEVIMKKLLASLADLPISADTALVSQPVPLSDAQVDSVTGGISYWDAMALYRQRLIGRGILPTVTANLF